MTGYSREARSRFKDEGSMFQWTGGIGITGVGKEQQEGEGSPVESAC